MTELTQAQKTFLNQIEKDAQEKETQKQDLLNRAARQQRAELSQRGMTLANEVMEQLPQLYRERFDLAAQLFPLLTQLYRNTQAINDHEAKALGLLNESTHRNSLPSVEDKFHMLRQNLNLPARDDTGIPLTGQFEPGQKYALTTLVATFKGLIQGGLIGQGDKAISLLFGPRK